MENSEQGHVPYQSVNGAWPCASNDLPKLDDAEAILAVKKLVRFAKVKRRITKFKIVTGNRHTWPRYGVWNVNAGRGWHALVHSVSHYCHRKLFPQHNPHHTTHAFLERSMIEHVCKSGWLEGKLRKPDKPKAEPGAREVRQAKLIRIEARIEAWRRKEQRARTALAKLARQRKYYEKALAA